MPLLKKKHLLAAKIESTTGDWEALADADAAFNVFDLSFQPTITFTPRQGNGSFSQMPSISEIQGGTVTFTTEIYGDGAGGVPGWASTFLPACGYVNAAGTFTPKSEIANGNVKTLSMAMYIDGRVKRMRGCVGNFVLNFETGKLATINWTFTGAWYETTSAAILTPAYPTELPLRVANGSFSIGAASPCFQLLTVDSGNELFLRPCASYPDRSGIAAGIITGRAVTGTINPESGSGAGYYESWLDSTEHDLEFQIENATDGIYINMPKWQIQNLQEGDRDGVVTDEITFQANRNSDAGNDELAIEFYSP